MEAFSSCVGRPALPRPSLPIVEMIRAAVRPASESRFVVTSSVGASALGTICSPPPSMSALSHTVMDSARAPWTARSLSWLRAASISWSHVTGWDMSSPAASATDLRYQSSCVLAQNGTVTSSSFQLAAASAPSRALSFAYACISSGTGARKPGSASSGTNGGSRDMMSIDVSPAARRRVSCSRWEAASVGSMDVSTLYRPFAASVHWAAIFACPPSSGLVYQVRVGVCSAGAHPARISAPAATAPASVARRR